MKINYQKKEQLAKKHLPIQIIEITDEYILFSHDIKITFDHDPDCCENNYADFMQIDDLARTTTFTSPIDLERIEGCGFRFGNSGKMFFVPCYSEQNGYYSDDIDIYLSWKDHLIDSISLRCEFVEC